MSGQPCYFPFFVGLLLRPELLGVNGVGRIALDFRMLLQSPTLKLNAGIGSGGIDFSLPA